MFGMKQNGKLSITIEKNKYFRRILKSAVIGSQDDLETIFPFKREGFAADVFFGLFFAYDA